VDHLYDHDRLICGGRHPGGRLELANQASTDTRRMLTWLCSSA
jgi:hypothetical protein